MGWGYGWGGSPYVSVASRKARAAKATAALRKKGRALEPVSIEGRTIARTFWGKSWCRNLERYSDYANRLPRGRSYLANGLVVDLKVAAGRVTALVQGSHLYEVEVSVARLPEPRWKEIRSECAGKIDSLVELLGGRLSEAVMAVVTRPGAGLFPAPADIQLRCSCPDSARLCKHLAAALYAIGARLDRSPELLFLLRAVDHLELVSAAAEAPVAAATASDDSLAGADLSSIFGIDLEGGDAQPAGATRAAPAPKRAKPPVRGSRPAKAAAREARVQALPAPSPQEPAAKRDGRPAPKAAPKPSPGRVHEAPTRSTSRARKPAEIRASELVALGISRATIRNWLAEQVLLPTEERGVYRKMKETRGRIDAYLARR